MISRLTASAALFAVIATAILTFATETHAQRATTARLLATGTARLEVVTLPAVTVTGHRIR